ncbi:hypothetical protein MA20_48785, partial [Bradyrhizobium japonicum]
LEEHITHNNESIAGWLNWMKTTGIAYFTGSAVMGVVVAFGCYFLVYAALKWYRKKKARRAVVHDNP